MPVADPVISGDQVRHDRIQDLESTVSVVVGIVNTDTASKRKTGGEKETNNPINKEKANE
ncbi:MAG: hypothetical protein JRH09_16735 [Deltaproteobacteria bacterium]|nr:hypothetical protein [Deltaproteobacteria bacterium]